MWYASILSVESKICPSWAPKCSIICGKSVPCGSLAICMHQKSTPGLSPISFKNSLNHQTSVPLCLRRAFRLFQKKIFLSLFLKFIAAINCNIFLNLLEHAPVLRQCLEFMKESEDQPHAVNIARM